MYAVIMAGGGGTRFWPLSRKKKPKQLLSLLNEHSLLVNAVNNLLHVIPIEKILIATNEDLKKSILKQLPNIPSQNLICEPIGRNTAPCIALAASYISKIKSSDDEMMLVLPADHNVKKVKEYQRVILYACELLQKRPDILLTFGIKPTSPETGYGYIKLGEKLTSKGKLEVYSVERFLEKPNFETACRMLKTGNFLWNSGIFMWKVSTILKKFQTLMPNDYENLEKIQEALFTKKEKEVIKKVYPYFTNISVDYAIMEKTKETYVVPSDFGWNDIGSWPSLHKELPKDKHNNAVSTKNSVLLNTQDCLFLTKKFVASIGVSNLAIVEVDDAILICNMDRAQDIREVVRYLEQHGKEELI